MSELIPNTDNSAEENPAELSSPPNLDATGISNLEQPQVLMRALPSVLFPTWQFEPTAFNNEHTVESDIDLASPHITTNSDDAPISAEEVVTEEVIPLIDIIEQCMDGLRDLLSNPSTCDYPAILDNLTKYLYGTNQGVIRKERLDAYTNDTFTILINRILDSLRASMNISDIRRSNRFIYCLFGLWRDYHISPCASLSKENAIFMSRIALSNEIHPFILADTSFIEYLSYKNEEIAGSEVVRCSPELRHTMYTYTRCIFDEISYDALCLAIQHIRFLKNQSSKQSPKSILKSVVDDVVYFVNAELQEKASIDKVVVDWTCNFLDIK